MTKLRFYPQVVSSCDYEENYDKHEKKKNLVVFVTAAPPIIPLENGSGAHISMATYWSEGMFTNHGQCKHLRFVKLFSLTVLLIDYIRVHNQFLAHSIHFLNYIQWESHSLLTSYEYNHTREGDVCMYALMHTHQGVGWGVYFLPSLLLSSAVYLSPLPDIISLKNSSNPNFTQ